MPSDCPPMPHIQRPRVPFAPLVLAVNLATCTLLGLGLCMPLAAQAQAQQRYDISAGPLGPALNLFAQQSRVALMFDAKTVAGLNSPGL